MLEVARDAAWCWFGDQRALIYGGVLYYGWTDMQGRVWVGRYNPVSGARKRQLLGSYNNAAGDPVPDDHSTPSLVMRGGRLCVFWCGHAGQAMRYRVANLVGSIDSFGPEFVCSAGNTPGAYGFTYPNPVDMSGTDGSLYNFWRGGDFQPAYSKSTTSVLSNGWTPAKHLFSVPAGQRPYVKVLGDDARGWIHFALTDGHPRNVHTSIYYARWQIEDGTFRRANGGLLGNAGSLPIPVANLDLVYNGAAPNDPAWIWDLQLGDTGEPHIVFATVPGADAHEYVAARWFVSGWRVEPVCGAGPTIAQDGETQYSGGIVIDPLDLNSVVVSRVETPDRLHRLERWHTLDDGSTWKFQTVLTLDDVQSVRPYFARGGSNPWRLLYLRGTYGTYTAFALDLFSAPDS